MKLLCAVILLVLGLTLTRGTPLAHRHEDGDQELDRNQVESAQWTHCRHLDVCSKQYEPVCGIDEEGVPRSFRNPCKMNYFNCMEGMYYVVVKTGVC